MANTARSGARQPADELSIGSQEIERRELLWFEPAQLFKRQVPHPAGNRCLEKGQLDGLVESRIVMDTAVEQRTNASPHSEFFSQFAFESALGAFAGLYLAAGKLPLQRERCSAPALTGQDPTFAFDDGRHDQHAHLAQAHFALARRSRGQRFAGRTTSGCTSLTSRRRPSIKGGPGVFRSSSGTTNTRSVRTAVVSFQ